MTLGQRVRAKRTAEKLTLAGLAKITGLSIPTLSKIETGMQKPGLRATRALAEWVGVSLEEAVE